MWMERHQLDQLQSLHFFLLIAMKCGWKITKHDQLQSLHSVPSATRATKTRADIRSKRPQRGDERDV